MRRSNSILYSVALAYTACVYGPMAAMSIGAGVVGAAWVVLRRGELHRDVMAFRSSPLFAPTLVFAFACLWSLVWASATGLAFMGKKPTIDWIGDSRKAWHLFFPLILAPMLATLTAARLRSVAKLWLGLGLASAVLGIVQYYVPLFNPDRLPHLDYATYSKSSGLLDVFRGSYHATGMAGFHLSYAVIIAFPAAVSLAVLAVLYRREGVSRRTRVAALATILFFMANVFTYSKMAWAAMPLTVVLIALIGFRGRPRYAIFGLLAIFCAVWGSSSEFRLRFQGTDTIRDRVEVWSANIEMIKRFPVFGVGWHRNSELSRAYYENKGIKGFESHAHNNLIDQWATTGLFGLGAFLWWSVAIVFMSLRVYKSNHDLLWRSIGLGFVGGWFCLHLNGLTQANYWDAKVLHQIGWVTALTMELYRRHRPNVA